MHAHGSFTLTRSGQILWSSCFGSWNQEAATLFLNAYKTAATELAPGWASIMDLTQWDLGTPDIWPVIDELNRLLNQTGFAFDAIIVNSKIKTTLMNRSSATLTTAQTRFFATVPEAIAWLQENELEFSNDEWQTLASA